MIRPTACPKCQGTMSEGVLVDNGYYAYTVGAWQAGAPVVSRWTGLKVNKKALIPTTAYRCGRCGFVELYAPPRP